MATPAYSRERPALSDNRAQPPREQGGRDRDRSKSICQGTKVGASGWYCFGEYDLVVICDVPDNESMSAIALVLDAGGALKTAKTTVLMTGAEGVTAMQKAGAVAKVYRPAR